MKELDKSKLNKQVFYLTEDNRVYTQFSEIPADAKFEVCYGMLDLVCSALLSDKTTNKLVKPMVAMLLVVFYILQLDILHIYFN